MNKSDIRIEAQRVRDNLNIQGDEGERAAQNFLAALNPQPNQIIALYMPMRRELDTTPLIHHLRARHVQTALPVIDTEQRLLSFTLADEETPLVPGPYGVLQPNGASVVPDIIVMPLLAFDRKGYRLGYGGGFYDRTLAKLHESGHNILCVGYAYAEQICLFPLPRDDHDWRCDMVITPQNAHDFRG